MSIGWYSLLGVVIFGWVAILDRVLWSSKPALSWYSTYPTGFSPELKARFPNHELYFVPEWVMSYMNISTENPVPAYYEHYDDWWRDTLSAYPEGPKNEPERDKREEDFWARWAANFTTGSDTNQPTLYPKQKIIDYFKSWEKWIFRDYYAATGIIEKTIMEESVRHIYELKYAHEMKGSSDGTDLISNEKRREIEKTTDAQKRFTLEIAVSHYKKKGEWFFFHIEEAFNNKYAPKGGFGPQTATTGTSHPARDKVKWKPNT